MNGLKVIVRNWFRDMKLSGKARYLYEELSDFIDNVIVVSYVICVLESGIVKVSGSSPVAMFSISIEDYDSIHPFFVYLIGSPQSGYNGWDNKLDEKPELKRLCDVDKKEIHSLKDASSSEADV